MSKARSVRSSPRREARHAVVLQRTACFTLNIGDGGFCVGVVRVLAPGTAVEGTIDLDGTPVPFSGTIAWAKPAGGDGAGGRVGVRFAPGPRGDAAAAPTNATGDETTEELPLPGPRDA